MTLSLCKEERTCWTIINISYLYIVKLPNYYTETEVNNLLSAKVNNSEVSVPNVINTIPKRDASGKIFVSEVNANNKLLANALDIVKESATALAITTWLNTVGIEISEEAATELITSKVKGFSFNEQFTSTSGIFNILKSNLAELKDKSIDDSTFFSDSAVKALARLEEGYISDLNANSFRAGNKTVYTYGSNKHLVNQMRKLKEINKSTLNGKEVYTNELMTELAGTNFTGTSFWLKDCLVLDDNGNYQTAENGQVVINQESSNKIFFFF